MFSLNLLVKVMKQNAKAAPISVRKNKTITAKKEFHQTV